MKEYLSSSKEVILAQKTSLSGLTENEAEARLNAYGHNKLAEGKKEGLMHRFFKQLTDPMTIILLAAALISGVLTVYNNMSGGEKEFPSDVIIIMAVVIINAVLGVVQESKAEAAIEALREISAATSKVVRDGRQLSVRSESLVPGDIIILEAGDAVPADARIIECASLKIEEAALTGESLPVTKTCDALSADEGKDVPLGDRKNMVYMGSTVAYGRGKAVVTGTGMNTEMGKIAHALTQAQESKTPLQIKLAQLSKVLTYLVVGICIIIFAISLIKTGTFEFATVLNTFMIAVSLAVAAIPEGLATVVTIVLSIGVTNMSKRSAIIRKMTAVETLGCTQIICSDKTGTLTQNKMTVVEHYGSNEKLIAEAMSLCSDAELDRETENAVGEPTECALVNYAYKLGLDKNVRKNEFVRVGEIPFDSSRKMMTTVHRKSNGELIQFTKGAPDVILSRCSHIYTDAGEAEQMSQKKYSAIASANKKMADSALRVLAVAMKKLAVLPDVYGSDELENELVFVGLVGMIDPVRPEVKPAIDECRNAGIRPIMITGDHKDTAVAIAKQLGIIESAEQAITGAELDRIPDDEFDLEVEKYSVYARVQPEHKTKIVNAWRKKGKVTAMTGDGVNDAPAIKEADIGVSMGISGTDVSKQASELILLDDNFSTLTVAVEQGRTIYSNIRKFVRYLISCNIGEVLTMLVGMLMGLPVVLLPTQILLVNLATDGLPAIALGLEPPEKSLMEKPPRKNTDSFFSNGLMSRIIFRGILIGLFTIASFVIGLSLGGVSTARTMALFTLVSSQLVHVFECKSEEKNLFSVNLTNNIWLVLSVLVSVLCLVGAIYIPFLQNVFSTVSLNVIQLLSAFGCAVAVPIMACFLPKR